MAKPNQLGLAKGATRLRVNLRSGLRPLQNLLSGRERKSLAAANSATVLVVEPAGKLCPVTCMSLDDHFRGEVAAVDEALRYDPAIARRPGSPIS